MAQIAFQDLTFSYPDQAHRALDGVSLEIEHGDLVCLCGRSGSGKTTLLRHLKTALAPHGIRTGKVLFEGRPLEDVTPEDQARFIGFVMQDPDAQLVTDKVWHEMAFGLENLGTDPRVMELRVVEMASFFGIQHWFHEGTAQLSGGQKQMLNLASVMALQPSVLVLDEPTAQLDPIAAADFLTTVQKINRELGVTVILTEHRLEDAFAMADAVVVMDAGRVTASGSPQKAARTLIARHDPLERALPTPIRIYGVVKGAAASPAQDAPLTVREGRTWLLAYERSHQLPVRALPQGALPESQDPALSLHEVWFRYDRDAPDILRGASLDVPRGSLFALLGGNGTGKSTLLKVLCGLVKPYRGEVQVMGRTLKKGARRSGALEGIALLPQDPQDLFVKQTVREDLLSMVAGHGDAPTLIQESADAFGVVGLLDRHPADLSGGEAQRAALAKVLLARPDVLLLDEPTKGVDAFAKEQLAKMLRDLTAEGLTILMVSHDVEFCARVSDEVALLFDGSVVAVNTPRAFFSQNSFYTTAANRMSRHVFANAVTDQDVIDLCLQ